MIGIQRINVLSLARALAGVLAGFGFGLAILIALLVIALPGEETLGFADVIIVLAVFPALLAIAGFFLGAVFAWLYNFTVKFTGAVELKME